MAVPPRFPNFKQPTAEEFESMIVELDAMRRVHCDIDGLKEKLRLLMERIQRFDSGVLSWLESVQRQNCWKKTDLDQ